MPLWFFLTPFMYSVHAQKVSRLLIFSSLWTARRPLWALVSGVQTVCTKATLQFTQRSGKRTCKFRTLEQSSYQSLPSLESIPGLSKLGLVSGETTKSYLEVMIKYIHHCHSFKTGQGLNLRVLEKNFPPEDCKILC